MILTAFFKNLGLVYLCLYRYLKMWIDDQFFMGFFKSMLLFCEYQIIDSIKDCLSIYSDIPTFIQVCESWSFCQERHFVVTEE